MPSEILGLVMLFALLTAIFIGYPIAFTLIVLAVVFGLIGFGGTVFNLMTLQTIGLMSEEVLAAVPLFLFMGFVVERSGIMERLFHSFQLLMGPVRGSLYLGVLFTSAVFAMATGIIGASVTVMGLMAGAAMIRSKYDPRLSSGAIAAGGTLGILIPPSVMLVVMGPVVGVSVVRLYAAAFIPGFLLAAMYITYAMVRSHLNPELGPPLALELRTDKPLKAFGEFLVNVVPLGLLVFAALGSILFGLATPTEAAAMGAFGAVVITALYRRMNYTIFRDAARKTLETSAMILFLAVAANMFGAVFTRLGTINFLTELLVSLPLSPILLLLLIQVIIFILGWPLEWPAIILIFLPIFIPTVRTLGYDLVWFSVLTAVNLQTAFLSPPVAMAAYYLRSVVPQWRLGQIYNGMLQFMILQVIGLILLLLFPQLVLWLPNQIYAR